MVGAHLDSEPDTAGINDNGSGSAGILEVALQMRKFKTKNKVRFAWWGAEESNLSGSTFYVANLPRGRARQDRPLPQLRHDRLAQLHVRRVRRRRLGRLGLAGPGPAGSAQIEEVFEAFFAVARRGHRGGRLHRPLRLRTVHRGRRRIPAGGLFTGAEVQKIEADVALWGGVAGAQYDPCYHAPCDSLTPERNGADAALYAQLRAEYRLFGNVNTFAIDTNADAIATAVATFAYDTSSIPPRTPAPAAARTMAPAAAAQTALAHLVQHLGTDPSSTASVIRRRDGARLWSHRPRYVGSGHGVHRGHLPRGAASAAGPAGNARGEQGPGRAARGRPPLARRLAVLPRRHRRRRRHLRRLPQGRPARLHPCRRRHHDRRARAARQQARRRLPQHPGQPARRPHLLRARPQRHVADQRPRPAAARRAVLRRDDGQRATAPQFALLVEIEQVFYHCAKAFLRSQLWKPETWAPDALPSRARIVKQVEAPTETLEALERHYGPAYEAGLYG